MKGGAIKKVSCPFSEGRAGTSGAAHPGKDTAVIELGMHTDNWRTLSGNFAAACWRRPDAQYTFPKSRSWATAFPPAMSIRGYVSSVSRASARILSRTR